MCIGRSGILWETARISFDGFRELRISENSIEGESWNPGPASWDAFRVDLSDGRVEGGSWAKYRSVSFDEMRRNAAI